MMSSIEIDGTEVEVGSILWSVSHDSWVEIDNIYSEVEYPLEGKTVSNNGVAAGGWHNIRWTKEGQAMRRGPQDLYWQEMKVVQK